MQTVNRSVHGTVETNGLVDGAAYHEGRKGAKRVRWTHPGLRITRLRLLSDPGYPMYDVSYCHGTLNGAHVDVELPFSELMKPNRRFGSLSSQIVEYAKRDKVYGRRLGILDAISILN